MTKAQIKEMQCRVGTEPDGIWGTQSNAACRRYLRQMMPSSHPWPKTDEASLRTFYGPRCFTDALVNLPAPVPMYFEGNKIKTIRCHSAVADSLSRALAAAYKMHPTVIRIYDGCYNCRTIAGSSTISLHARGAAIDIDAEHNGNKTHWPNKAWMPLDVIECFAREGWLSGGAFWNRDAMHFQATQ